VSDMEVRVLYVGHNAAGASAADYFGGLLSNRLGLHVRPLDGQLGRSEGVASFFCQVPSLQFSVSFALH